MVQGGPCGCLPTSMYCDTHVSESDMPVTRSAASSNRTKDDKRIFTDVILPIKSRFVGLIVSGDKNYEYRNYKLRDSVKRLWLYEVAPSRRIRYSFVTMYTHWSDIAVVDTYCTLDGRNKPVRSTTLLASATMTLTRASNRLDMGLLESCCFHSCAEQSIAILS